MPGDLKEDMSIVKMGSCKKVFVSREIKVTPDIHDFRF